MNAWLRLWIVGSLAFALPVGAQFDTATLLGAIHDSTGARIAGARVTLANTGTAIASQTTTDESGNYLFLNVRSGGYRVTAEASGFSTAVADGVDVRVGARQRVDLTLAVGAVSETVEVTGAARLVEADSSDRGQIINRQQIVELPLNGRAYSDLALLSTGVRRSTLSAAVDSQGGNSREGSFNVNGLRSTFNNFLMDGVDNNSYGTSNQGFSNQVIQMSPDAVAEFKVVTNNVSAEYGRSGGAAINAVMKSGTNAYHGSAYEFVRNTKLNSTGFFRPTTGTRVLQRNQFGFTFGGPIVKNSTFFFLDYEGSREIQRSPQFNSIPTLDDRLGIFDKSVRNPLTNELFPANTPIPPAGVSSFARSVMGNLPAPNGPGRSNNYQSLPQDRDFSDKMDAKIDRKINDRMTAFARLSHRKNNFFNEPAIPGASGGAGNGFTRVVNQQLAASYTYTVTPSSLLEFRLGLSKTRAGKEPVGTGGPSMRELYGITGLPEDKSITGPLTTQNISGFASLGRRATNPQWQHPFVVNPRVNYSWILGRHSLKAGYEYQRIHTEVQDVNPLYGQDTYSGNFSRPAGGPADSATYNLADFLFGNRSGYSLVTFFIAQYRQRMHFGYLQDDFKVSSRLTLNLGARYEYATPQWEAENKLSNYDPGGNRMILAQAGSLYDRALVNPDRNNFAPRVGFAYTAPRGLVVRGGYGIAHTHFNRAGGGNLLALNGPQVVNGSVSQIASEATFRTTQQGYPVNFTAPEKFDPLLASVKYMTREQPAGYVQSWFFSLQREIARYTLLDVAYVGNRGVKLAMFGDYNQARPNRPTEDEPLQQRRPIPGFANIGVGFQGGWSNYHGLQARLERRAATGLFLLQSFTWSKALDNVGQALETPNGGSSNPQNLRDLRPEKGLSAYDQTLTSVTSVVWQIPVGKGRKLGTSLPVLGQALVGGWELSAINNMWSGQPITLRYSAPSQFNVGGVSLRPNLIGPALAPPESRNIDNYFNRNNVVLPTDRSQPFGNAARNSERSHALYQLDLGVHKDFALPRERMTLQFRGEFFNLLNKTNFFPATGDRSSSAFGAIRATFQPREAQLALKMYW